VSPERVTRLLDVSIAGVSDASAQPRRIGRYEIVGALAHGGMAELFVARLPGIEGFTKRVVLKRVLPALASDREFVDMFIAEARIAATLDHQNIVQVHDIGQDADGYFFAMELLHGADVGDLLRTTQDKGGLPLAIALELARAACAGLHYAHERTGPTGAPLGLVHRDISPQNMFVTFDGAVKLLDWGIAKAVQRISNHFTRSGTLRGKIPYMSPEQCRGEPLDRRSDVFSLAVVLWEMTVGERLFGARGESDFDTLKQIIEQDAPAPSARAADYPPELERIVMKATRRDPRERYQTADALQVDLEAFMRASSRWASTRDLAAFMTATYPERAAETRQPEPTPPGKGGRIVPFPRAQGTDAPMPGRATVELPIEDALAPTQPAAPQPQAPAPAPPASPAPVAPASAAPASAAPASASPSPGSPRRPRAAVLAAIALAVLAAVVLAFALGRSSAPAPSEGSQASPSPGAPVRPAEPGSEDAHWFQSDDYLVSKKRYTGEKLSGLRVAKMTRSPARPRSAALFLDTSGTEVETESYWATRIARPEDLSIGRLAMCQTASYDKKAGAPATRQAARLGTWILAKVTDTMDLANGKVSVGDTVCSVAGVRVPVPAAP
jgi:hypothetical protein